MVLYAAESSHHLMRCRPNSRESKELVREANQCRYGIGEGASRANDGHEDVQSGGGGELRNALRPAL